MENETINTRYGTIIVLVKNAKIYLSRRIDTKFFPKKWQFINGMMRGHEQSFDTATRLIEKETGLIMFKNRLYFTQSLEIKELQEFYYIYLVSLRDDETPQHIESDNRSDWKEFELNAAVVLDLVPGLRGVILKLVSSYLKFTHSQLTVNEILKGKAITPLAALPGKGDTQILPVVVRSNLRTPTQDQMTQGLTL